MNLNQYTLKSREIIDNMQVLAHEMGHQEIGEFHLLMSLLKTEDSIVLPILQKQDCNIGGFAKDIDAELKSLPQYLDIARFIFQAI